MNAKLTLLLALLSLPLASTAAAQGDRCSDVLALGVQERFNLSSSQSLESSMYELVCSEQSRGGSSSSGFRFQLPIPELGGFLGMGSNTSNMNQSRSAWCSNQNRQTSSANALRLARSVVNNEAVRAWERCMNNEGLMCRASPLDERRFEIEVTWRIDAQAPDPRITSRIRATGANCANPLVLREGAVIPSHGSIVEVCERQGDGDALVDFATTQGHVRCRIPARRRQPTFAEAVRQCLDGERQGCVEMRLLGMQARESCLSSALPHPRGLVADRQRAVAAQVRAAAERQCGNIAGNVTASEALIENARRACRGGSTSACQQSRSQALAVASRASDEIARALAGRASAGGRGR